LLTQPPIFTGLVRLTVASWAPQVDRRRMREFTVMLVNFYNEPLPAFVCVQWQARQIVPIDAFVKFLMIEITRGREEWIVCGIFETLIVVVELGGRELTPEMFELSLKVASVSASEVRSCSLKWQHCSPLREATLALAV
jgi:hypothetical protein